MADLRTCLKTLEAVAPGRQITTTGDWEHAPRARLDLVDTTKVRYAYLDPEQDGASLRLYVADTLGLATSRS